MDCFFDAGIRFVCAATSIHETSFHSIMKLSILALSVSLVSAGISCDLTFRPVCSTDKQPFMNKCLLLLHKKIPASRQSLKVDLKTQKCIKVDLSHCSRQVFKVCGLDGDVYRNKCTLQAAGDTQRKCPPIILSQSTSGTVCPSNYDPVCGKDGKVYSNSCVMKAAGQTLGTQCKSNSINM